MKKAMAALFRGIEILIAVFLVLMIVLVFMNVIYRYVFSRGFAWSEEIARLCFIYLVYLGAIGAARDNRHLLVESLLLRVPRTAQKIVFALVQMLTIWVMALLGRGSLALAVQNLHDKWVATSYPVFLIHGVGVITGLSIIILSVLNLYRLIFLKTEVLDLVGVCDGGEPEKPAGTSGGKI